MSRVFADQTLLAKLIWGALGLSVLDALFQGNWPLAAVALATLALSLAPVFAARWAEIVIPPSFITAIVLFVGSTLFLGEVFDFYDRFWWWDVAMHGGSAIGLGLVGFVMIFMMFQGDRYAAPPIAMAFFSFCFALAMGALWEIFEYGMDSLFGMNMQRTGLDDTMRDLMVDVGGALIGAASGFAYLKGLEYGGLPGIIDEFVRRNPRLFRRGGGGRR
ncbi:MAG: hypothetical protein FH759_13460 [Sediminimonas qiaohouensis]|uniref:DUF2238 domain-containing protein n=1 Tax=Sediminimonas qiaohouensis TaxID=552061 RepID=A0A7C9HBY7_9RHOB|nr:hypothetical protein [Sediminimonas qiaohouensis]MTJ05686.1 hypothetical protein [Sediminimonas qiaohouensis]